MNLLQVQTEIFSCTASFLPWAGVLLVKVSVLLLGVGLLAAAVGRRHVALAHLVGIFGLGGLLLLLPASLLSLSSGWPSMTPPQVDTATADRTALIAILAVWSAGALFLLARLLLDALFLNWHARVEARAPLPERCAQAHALARALGIRKPVRVLQSSSVDIPYTWGFLQPVVVLPASGATWSRERFVAVLTHELGHVRRRDPLAAVLARVACALFWFHPLTWWVACQAGESAERACDALVVQRGIAPLRYARHLLDIVRDARRPETALAPTMARRSMLARRITVLLERRPGTVAVTRGAGLLLLIVMTVPTLILAATALPGTDASVSSGEASVCSDGVSLQETRTDPISTDPVSMEPAAEDTSPVDNF